MVPIGTYHVNRFFGYAFRVAKPTPEIIGSAVCRLLQAKRESLGLSMRVVAVRAGISHTMVSRIERGLRKPTLDILLRMSGAMGVDLWPLIKKAEVAAAREAPAGK